MFYREHAIAYPMTTVLRHMVVQSLCGANMFYREHALA